MMPVPPLLKSSTLSLGCTARHATNHSLSRNSSAGASVRRSSGSVDAGTDTGSSPATPTTTRSETRSARSRRIQSSPAVEYTFWDLIGLAPNFASRTKTVRLCDRYDLYEPGTGQVEKRDADLSAS